MLISEPILYIFVSVVVREDQFQNGVAHITHACTDQVGHCGQVDHVVDIDIPFAQISHAGHIGHWDQAGQTGHVGQSFQSGHIGQTGHWDQAGQTGHGAQLVQLAPAAHVAQAGHVGQSGQAGHVSSVDQSIKVFSIKIISQLLSIHNIFSTPVKSLASSQDRLPVYNLIFVQVFISNNLVASLSVQSIDTIILFIVCIELSRSVNISGI